MDRPRVEARILVAVDRVLKGSKQEDDLVEFKAILPEGNDAARRIAAQLNAARGEPITWIVGIDERTGDFFPTTKDLANWWPSVRKYFEDKAPSPDSIIVSVDSEHSVLGIHFEALDLPYVVRNPAFNTPNGGQVEFEVPWRELTSTRTARRSDILRVLVPALRAPAIEIVSGTAELMGRPDAKELFLRLLVFTYVVPVSREAVVIPFRKCSGVLVVDGEMESLELVVDDVSPRTFKRLDDHGSIFDQPLNSNITLTNDEVAIPVPSLVRIRAGRAITAGHRIQSATVLEGSLYLHVISAATSSRIEFKLRRTQTRRTDLLALWECGDHVSW